MQKVSRKRITLFDTPIDGWTMNETVLFIDEMIQSGKQIEHTCINANKVVMMNTDPSLKRSVSSADIISPDGKAIVWASRIVGRPLPERVSGIDLMERLIQFAGDKKYSVYFFGARQEVVESVAKKYSDEYTSKIVGGFRNGYYEDEDLPQIALDINQSGSQMLFVAIPSPKKENFIHQYAKSMPNVTLLMGVGGSFDVVTGRVKRAPAWMQNSGLEWLFRLMQEPGKMWKRYLIGNIKYIQITIREVLKKQNSI